MKILILAERFYPEEFLINDLASEWKKSGYEVEVLTQSPSYPHDRIYPGYRNRLFQTTVELNGIPVHRVRTVLGYNSRVSRKILNYVNFAFLTGVFALFNGWKYDRIFAFHSGPLTMAYAGVIFKFLWWKKCMIWTQDAWPDTVYNYGIKPTWIMRKFLGFVVRTVYWGYRIVSVSCPGFIKILKPYTSKDVFFLPQWTTQSDSLPERNKQIPVVFTFAGNIGSVQNLDKMVKIFGDLRDDRMLLKIVGGGIFLERLQKTVIDNGYQNILFTGRLPLSSMPEQFNNSDVLVISLKSDFDLTIPAKFQAYIAAGRPVLGLIRGDVAALIQQYDLGMAADPDDAVAIAAAFRSMVEADDEAFEKWRKNALTLSNKEFNRDKIIKQMTELLVSE